MWYRIFVLIALLLTLPPAVLAQDDPDAGASAAEISSAEPDDQGFLTRFLQSRLSNAGRSVQIDGFHGALSSRATFERITIADADGVWLTLHDGAIQWNRSALLRGQVQVGELTAALIEIPRAPLSGEREQQERRSQSRSFELPELPVGIHIDRIDASRVVLGSPLLGEEAVISVTGEMSLAGGEGTADVVISRTDGKKGKFVFDGSFDNTTRVLNIDLSLDEAAGGIFARTVGIEGSPAVMATIAGEGPLSDYQADIQIATDGIDRISGHLSFAAADDSEGTPGNRFELEVGGDLATLLPPQNREFFGDSTLIVAQGWRAGTGRMEIEALRLDTDALKINGRMSTNDQNAPQVLDLTVDFGQQAGAQTLPVRIPFMNPPISVLSGNLAIGYDATQGSDWRLKGWLTEIDRAGLRLARLDLDGAGHVALTADEALEQVDGNLGFDASGISLVSARMQQVVGDRISGRTGFDFTPGQVVTFSDMQIEGGDYGLEGRLTVDGLTSGIVLSSDHVIARHDDLSKLSDFAGRPLSGRARAELAGFFQLLTGAFDIDGVVTGTDISVNSKRIDHLLAGDATIELSAGRTDDGTDLRELTVTAQRITLGADGFIWDDHVDLTVDFNVPTLADLDPDFQGELSATARLAGAPGSRRITLEGEAQGLRTGVAALDGAFAGETSLSARLSEDARGGFDLNELRLGNEQLDLTGSGTIAGAAVNADFDLNFKDIGALGESFAGAAQATARIVTEAGQRRILVNGSGRNLSVGQADLDAALAGETRLSLTAAQGNDQITISDARLENDQFSATATGTVSGAGMNIQAQAAVPAMAALGRGWHGSLSADAVMTQGPQGTRNIRIDAVGQDLALGQQNLDGALGGRTDITLLAEQAAQGGVLTLKSLDIRNPQLTANAQGTLDAGAVNGQAGAQIADLAALGRGWSGSLNADARLTTAADGTRRVEIDGSGQDIRLGQAQADAALTGTTTIDILAEQAGDGAIRIERAEVVNDQLNASAQGEIGQTRTDATGRLNVRDLASLGLGLQGALDLDAAFADVGDGARRLRVTGTGQNLALGQQGNAGRLSGTTDIGIDAVERDGTYTIERAELTNDQTHIQAEGSIGPAGTDARAVMDMRDLAALGLGMGGALKAEASLRDDGTGSRAFVLNGTGTDLSFGQAGADQALAGETRIAARGTENGGLLTIEAAQIENPRLNADASGIWGQGRTDLNAGLRADNLSFVGAGFGGALDASARIRDTARGRSFDLTGTGRDLRLGNAQADGALAGETRVNAQVIQSGNRFVIEELQAENPQITLSGEGVLGGGQTRFDAQLASRRDLAFLGPGFGGSAQATAVLRDQDGALQFQIDGTGHDIAVGVAQLDAALSGQTTLAVNGHRQADGLIRLDSARAANGPLSATASGVYGAGRTDIVAELSAGNLGFVSDQLGGSVNATARLTDQAGGMRVTAQGTANGLRIGNDRADRLLAGQTRAEMAALIGPNGFVLERLDARNPQLQIIADGDPARGLNVDGRLADLSPLLDGVTGPAQAVGTIRQEDAGTRMDIAVTAPGGTRAQISGLLAGAATDLRMSGVSDAAVVNPMLRTRSVEGPASFDLRMQGEPGLDSLTGEVRLINGRLSEPRMGMTVNDLDLAAQLARGLIDINAGGNLSAGGAFGVTGSIDLRPASPVLDLRARLNRAVLRDPNLYELTADGVVSVTGVAADGPLVSGTINILEAEFRIPSTGLGGVQAIPDIVHVNDNWQIAATRAKAGLEPYGSLAAQAASLAGPAAVPPPNPARFDLTINAPNQIFIRGRGVDAELGGSTRLTGDARNPIPIGHLSLIRGRVDLLGKRFDLTEGLVELQGNLVPVIRLVAVHTESDISTSIIIDGEVSDPDITFESDPELPQEEVLSYLLFGRGLDQITALQALQLANGLAVLAGQGGIGVIGNIREAAGLDDLDLTMDDEGNVSIRAGRYLTRDVYTDVELEDSGRTRVNINLDLTNSLTARASADNEGDSSLGLHYERDY